MFDLDSLEKYWPLISQHPWAFGRVFIVGVVVGWAIHKVWSMLTSPHRKSAETIPLKKGPSAPRAPFQPSRHQIGCIALMRHFDDEWLTQEQIAAGFDRNTPRADVRQALEGLVAAGWVADRLNAIHPTEYRLKEPGLNYAREHNFNVQVRPQY